MKKYGVNELRRMYLEFFESKGHLAMKSFSLVPHNDNSLLLINAGMAPLKPYFTGQEIPPIKIAPAFLTLVITSNGFAVTISRCSEAIAFTTSNASSNVSASKI